MQKNALSPSLRDASPVLNLSLVQSCVSQAKGFPRSQDTGSMSRSFSLNWIWFKVWWEATASSCVFRVLHVPSRALQDKVPCGWQGTLCKLCDAHLLGRANSINIVLLYKEGKREKMFDQSEISSWWLYIFLYQPTEIEVQMGQSEVTEVCVVDKPN